MHDEQTAAVLDSASTWAGVRRADGSLSLDGHEFGHVDGRSVAAAFPERLAEAAVRHGRADALDEPGWTTVTLGDGGVYRAVALLRLSYLSHVALVRRWRPEAFPSVDIEAGLDELQPSPGVRHLVREQARE